MIILGIQEAHDASAAIMIDGKIVAAAQEERFTRLKGDYGFPKNAVKFCMDFANVKGNEIDIVALASLNWNPVLTKIKRNANFTIQDWVDEQNKFWKYELLFPELGKKVNYYDLYKDRHGFKYDDFYPMDDMLKGYMDKGEMQKMLEIRRDTVADYLRVDREKVKFIKHEDCHTAYAYYGSHLNGENVLSLTAEGIGDYSNATFSVQTPWERIEYGSTKECHIGHIYQFMTLLLGMKPAQHEYKVMGLAPYAPEWEVKRSYEIFKNILKIDKDRLVPVYDKKPKDLYFYFREALEGHRFDGIAGAVQRWTENVLYRWVHSIFDVFHNKPELRKIRKVVFSGGVAQNIKACKVMTEVYPDARVRALDDFFVMSASGDASLCIGACYEANREMGYKSLPIEDVYLGPAADDKKIEEKFVNIFVNRNTYSVSDSKYFYKRKGVALGDWNEDTIAKLLADGKIVARCSGRMEFGHRALGNRSILADPRNPDIIRKINKAVKGRDFWMPFAPVIVDSDEGRYIKNPMKLKSPYMTMAFDTTDKGRQELKAAIHPADHTCRPQILEKQTNPELYDIIEEFNMLTGVGALLNTSLNFHGEPIVNTAEEALRVFKNSGIDAMILGDYLLEKKEGKNDRR